MLGTAALTVGSVLRGTIKRRDGPSVRHKVVLGTVALTVKRREGPSVRHKVVLGTVAPS